jgi:hypothetical protein
LLDTFQRLVVRNPKRTEAEIQADVRQFILSAPFELESGDLQDVNLESPVGDRRRIDVEAGSTVIEVKRDLRKEKPKKEAEEQLAGYVDSRMIETGLRYVGVLTDGTEWNCYNLVDGKLQQISDLTSETTEEDDQRPCPLRGGDYLERGIYLDRRCFPEMPRLSADAFFYSYSARSAQRYIFRFAEDEVFSVTSSRLYGPGELSGEI